jgi:hypothetical protein
MMDEYEQSIEAAFDRYINRRQPYMSICSLMLRMGCSHLTRDPDTFRPVIEVPEQRHGKYEPLITKSLIGALRQHVADLDKREMSIEPVTAWNDPFDLMSGLSKNRRWEACLSSSEAAYDLVVLIFHFALMIETLRPPEATPAQKREASEDGRRLLNEWLAPTLFDEFPNADRLTHELFGEAWALLGGAGTVVGSYAFVDVIRAMRPALRNGLMPSESAPLDVILPAMDLS